MTTVALTRYRDLERRLWYARFRFEGMESAEEDAILEEMDEAWQQLSGAEREELDAEGPRCWPTELGSPPSVSATPWVYPVEALYEGFASAAEAAAPWEG